jgi:hypothetical protein
MSSTLILLWLFFRLVPEIVIVLFSVVTIFGLSTAGLPVSTIWNTDVPEPRKSDLTPELSLAFVFLVSAIWVCGLYIKI